MDILEIILTGLSLSMDAFIVSIYKGLGSINKIKKALKVALFFGIFQFIMPIIGYMLGNIFSQKIIIINPYLSVILLISIGLLMFKEDNNIKIDNSLKLLEMFLLSIATSIDALVVGISFSFLKINLFESSIIIGIITFIMCFIGFILGNTFNHQLGKYTNKIGGTILIIIAIKTFLENLLK